MEALDECVDGPSDTLGTNPHGPSPVGLVDERTSSTRGVRRDSLVPRTWPPGRDPSCEFAPLPSSQGASPCDGFHEVLPRRVRFSTCALVARCTRRQPSSRHARSRVVHISKCLGPHGPGRAAQSLSELTLRAERCRFPGRGLLVVRASRRFCRRIARRLQGFVLRNDRHADRSLPWLALVGFIPLGSVLRRPGLRFVPEPSSFTLPAPCPSITAPGVLESCEAAESLWPSAIANPSGLRGLAAT